jgi:hypothetical protein
MTASSTTKPTTTPLSQLQKKCTTCTNQSCKSLARKPTATTTAFPKMASTTATTTAASTAAKTTTLSPFQKFASVFREAHPIGRVPTYLKPHDRPAMSHYLRRMGRTGKMFVPFMVAFCTLISPSQVLSSGMISAADDVVTDDDIHSWLAIPNEGIDQRQ